MLLLVTYLSDKQFQDNLFQRSDQVALVIVFITKVRDMNREGPTTEPIRKSSYF